MYNDFSMYFSIFYQSSLLLGLFYYYFFLYFLFSTKPISPKIPRLRDKNIRHEEHSDKIENKAQLEYRFFLLEKKNPFPSAVGKTVDDTVVAVVVL